MLTIIRFNEEKFWGPQIYSKSKLHASRVNKRTANCNPQLVGEKGSSAAYFLVEFCYELLEVLSAMFRLLTYLIACVAPRKKQEEEPSSLSGSGLYTHLDWSPSTSRPLGFHWIIVCDWSSDVCPICTVLLRRPPPAVFWVGHGAAPTNSWVVRSGVPAIITQSITTTVICICYKHMNKKCSQLQD